MKLDAPLDYAEFYLSPNGSRYKLFVSSDGNTEKLASGLVKPFAERLKFVEEHIASDARSIKLEIGRHKDSENWFTKGTLERFVRYVSMPEVLELVISLDDEMCQLESTRSRYTEGAGGQLYGTGGPSANAAANATMNELLREMDVRLDVIRQDLSSACARATAAGFNSKTVLELQMFAKKFGAHHLNESCGKFISLTGRRSELINPWISGYENQVNRSSCGLDVSSNGEKSSGSQQLKAQSFAIPVQCNFSRESSVKSHGADKPINDEDEKESPASDQVESAQPARRLSVQDRISLLENKQKENSVSGGKPMVAKSVELQRMSSDVGLSKGPSPVVEKAVLRRWSGDVITDVDSQKKDNESPFCTAPEEKMASHLNDPGSTVNSKEKMSSFNKSEHTFDSSNSGPNLGPAESDGWKDSMRGTTQSSSFISRPKDHNSSEEKFRSPDSKSNELIELADQVRLKCSQSGEELGREIPDLFSGRRVFVGNDRYASETQMSSSGSIDGGQVEISNQMKNFGLQNQFGTELILQLCGKTVRDSGPVEGSAGSNLRQAFAARYKGIERESLSVLQEGRSTRRRAKIETTEFASSEKVSGTWVEDSRPQRTNVQKEFSSPELIKKTGNQKESTVGYGNKTPPLASKLRMQIQEGFDSFITQPSDQVQPIRRLKGNRKLKDLKMKANELEKLFSEHKRGIGDQSSTADRSKSAGAQPLSAASLYVATSQSYEEYPLSKFSGNSKKMTKLSAARISTYVDSPKYNSNGLDRNFTELRVLEGSRGEFYDKYIQKREAKLRDEWCYNRAEKEARFKSMHDSLEHSRAEMKAKLLGYAERQDSTASARRRAERLRSFNTRLITRDQQHLDLGNIKGGENALEFLEQKRSHFSDNATFRRGGGRSLLDKNVLTTKSLSLPRPHPSAALTPGSATKIAAISSGKQRMQSENALAQSVPNSDLRKENTKPSRGTSQTIQPQEKNYGHIKSTTAEALILEKSRRLQSCRKSSANPRDLRENSLDSDGVILAPQKYDEEVMRNVQTKPSFKKGSSSGFVSRANIMKLNDSMVSESTKGDESEDLASGQDHFVNMIKNGYEAFETMNLEGNSKLDNDEEERALETEKLSNSGSESGYCMKSFSLLEQALGAKLPTISSFDSVKYMDLPGEIPSWNSCYKDPFSYSSETSEVDASLDSPVGSPASSNSHSLSQVESDAARTRKKWGTAQKPAFMLHSSNDSPHNDMVKGFGCLPKFGSKSRGSESLVDWISVTTSEGDNDTDDGKDPDSCQLVIRRSEQVKNEIF